MPNLTITTDEETLRWARIEAAKRGISVSKLVGELLAEQRKKSEEYQRALAEYLASPPWPLPEEPPRADGRLWPTREEIYDRAIFKK
ncbi:MAG: hypothetical protein N3C63_00045 [Rhodocyclaceae bacterium]|nr:hypothetical protein [Rhodocyclaceae bacterium]